MIPLFKVAMSECADGVVADVLASGYIGEGEKVKEFTELCAEFLDNPYVVPVSSGTAAIEIALRLAGVGSGDKVISTPMTCLATNMPILDLGAEIIWADVEKHTGLIDRHSVESILTWEPDIKAIVGVDWGGAPFEMEITNVPLIEDAAHAWGSQICGVQVGHYGRFTCFSFQAIKHLTTGDGGLLALSFKDDYEKAKLMKWFGLDREKTASMRCDQDPPLVGLKRQMNDIAAAIGIANFELAKLNIELAQQNAREYDNAFLGLPFVKPVQSPYGISSRWLYPVLVDSRDAFEAFLKDHEIECSQVHSRNDKKTLFKNFERHLPGVDYFSSHQTNIPVGWWLSREERRHIIETVRSYNNGYTSRSNQQEQGIRESDLDSAATSRRIQRQ